MPWNNGFALVVASHEGALKLASPKHGMVTLLPDDLEENFPEGIELLLMERSNATPDQKFGPGWFWPALKRYRGVLIQVLAASFVVQLFTLANPLLIQVIIDKVIGQRISTPCRFSGSLVVVTVLEGAGQPQDFCLRKPRIASINAGAEVIDHLLRLPLGYFDRYQVGELGTRVAEQKIRNFLTGQAHPILDAAFSLIYIAVMVIYSWLLTLIALSVLPIQIGLTLLGLVVPAPVPLLLKKTKTRATLWGAHRYSDGEGPERRDGESLALAGVYSVHRPQRKTITGTALNQTSQVFEDLQLMVLWIGASMVLSGDLTLGQLIAFRIISGYVTQPLLGCRRSGRTSRSCASVSSVLLT